MRSRQPFLDRRIRAAVLLLAASVSACSTLGAVKDTFLGGSSGGSGPQRLEGFIGAAVADEPRAALTAREVLALGGNAADAATALGFTLAVTLPSRAGLGGGGMCVAYNPSRDGPGGGSPEAFDFTPVAPATPNGPADRPAAVPMLARGLFALHAKYGSRPFESLVSPAEQLARFGVPVSRALLQDLAVVAGPLIEDPNARAVFAPGGTPLQAGATLSQPDLGGTLATLRTAGVGDLYQGGLARKLEDGSRLAGGGMTVGDLRGGAAADRRAAGGACGPGQRGLRAWGGRTGRGGGAGGIAGERARPGRRAGRGADGRHPAGVHQGSWCWTATATAWPAR